MAVGVVLGAFGAHGLQNLNDITPRQVSTWDTAVLYHLLHSLGLILVGMALVLKPNLHLLRWVARFFVLGVLLFSGSLYALVLGAPSWLGPVTPLGGTFLIAGWLLFSYATWHGLSKAGGGD